MESRTDGAGGSAEAFGSRPGTDRDVREEPAEEPRRRSRQAAGRPSGPRRPKVPLAIALVLAVAVGLYGLTTLGPVRTILRQSFTNQTAPSVDFYFNGAPYISGEWLEVHLGVLNAPASGVYSVRLWIVDAKDKVLTSQTTELSYTAGRGEANVNVLLNGNGEMIWAQLEGTALTLHYRFEGSPLGTLSPSASATG